MRDTENVRKAWQEYIDTDEDNVDHFDIVSNLIDSLAELAEIKLDIDLKTDKVSIIDTQMEG